jgi:hypothetical protein
MAKGNHQSWAEWETGRYDGVRPEDHTRADLQVVIFQQKDIAPRACVRVASGDAGATVQRGRESRLHS